MDLLHIITDSKGNIAYSFDSANWTPVNYQPQNIVISYDKLYWFPITRQVKNILSCIKRKKNKGVAKLKQYISQHVKL